MMILTLEQAHKRRCCPGIRSCSCQVRGQECNSKLWLGNAEIRSKVEKNSSKQEHLLGVLKDSPGRFDTNGGERNYLCFLAEDGVCCDGWPPVEERSSVASQI